MFWLRNKKINYQLCALSGGLKEMKATTSQRVVAVYSKTCVIQPLSKRPKIVFQYQLSLIAGQKYCRMLHGEHSAILSTFIKETRSVTMNIFRLKLFSF